MSFWTILRIMLSLTVLVETNGKSNKRGVSVIDMSSDYNRLSPQMFHNPTNCNYSSNSTHEHPFEMSEGMQELILRGLGLKIAPKVDWSSIPNEELKRETDIYNSVVSRGLSQRESTTFLLHIVGESLNLLHPYTIGERGDVYQVIWLQIPENFKEDIGDLISAKAHMVEVGKFFYPEPRHAIMKLHVCFSWITDRLEHGHELYETELHCEMIPFYNTRTITFDITKHVLESINNPHRYSGISIRCPDCEEFGVIFPILPNNRSTKVTQFEFAIKTRGLTRFDLLQKPKNKEFTPLCEDPMRMTSKKSDKCCRRPMRIKLSGQKGFDFIVSPKEFDAYYCSGQCPAQHSPVNEHSVMQSFVHARNRTVSSPCCSAQEHEGIQVLHVNENGNLTTTLLRDFVVTKCGCA